MRVFSSLSGSVFMFSRHEHAGLQNLQQLPFPPLIHTWEDIRYMMILLVSSLFFRTEVLNNITKIRFRNSREGNINGN